MVTSVKFLSIHKGEAAFSCTLLAHHIQVRIQGVGRWGARPPLGRSFAIQNTLFSSIQAPVHHWVPTPGRNLVSAPDILHPHITTTFLSPPNRLLSTPFPSPCGRCLTLLAGSNRCMYYRGGEDGRPEAPFGCSGRVEAEPPSVSRAPMAIDQLTEATINGLSGSPGIAGSIREPLYTIYETHAVVDVLPACGYYRQLRYFLMLRAHNNGTSWFNPRP